MTDDNVTEFPKSKRPPGPGRGHKIKQGSGLPAVGAGWGGEAKGEGAGPEALIPGQGAEKRAITEMNRAAEDKLKLEAMNTMVEIMRNPEAGHYLRGMFAEKVLNRIDGLPVARNINVNVTEEARMSDDELAAERERIGRIRSSTSS